MNNRIKELAIQAGAEQVATDPDGKLVKYITPEMQKFAELLVQECANIVATTEIEFNSNALLRGEIATKLSKLLTQDNQV